MNRWLERYLQRPIPYIFQSLLERFTYFFLDYTSVLYIEVAILSSYCFFGSTMEFASRPMPPGEGPMHGRPLLQGLDGKMRAYIACLILFYIISSVFLGLRLWVRAAISRKLAWDDGVLLVSHVSNVAAGIMWFYAMFTIANSNVHLMADEHFMQRVCNSSTWRPKPCLTLSRSFLPQSHFTSAQVHCSRCA